MVENDFQVDSIVNLLLDTPWQDVNVGFSKYICNDPYDIWTCDIIYKRTQNQPESLNGMTRSDNIVSA